MVSSNAALRVAIYREPASNVTGWRLLAAWMHRPRAGELAGMLAVLAARDAATLEQLGKTRRRSRSSR